MEALGSGAAHETLAVIIDFLPGNDAAGAFKKGDGSQQSYTPPTAVLSRALADQSMKVHTHAVDMVAAVVVTRIDDIENTGTWTVPVKGVDPAFGEASLGNADPRGGLWYVARRSPDGCGVVHRWAPGGVLNLKVKQEGKVMHIVAPINDFESNHSL
ncbi:hypothetical protein T492DRAFT_76475 [Pavlovales sp. CCMP2436]|nr:hypothetical protein T492DRAFT_76475 [Pavlovales sp. CCMP2436]